MRRSECCFFSVLRYYDELFEFGGFGLKREWGERADEWIG